MVEKVDLFDNKGFISLIDYLGTDLTIVNSARVSFGKRKAVFDDKDVKLLKYLAEHKHMSPFRQVYLQFHLKAPEAIMRQIWKHCIGMQYTQPMHHNIAWNEISGRYVEYDDVYEPKEFRPQHEKNKQASKDGDLSHKKTEDLSVREVYQEVVAYCKEGYQKLLRAGVAKEQARLIMPFATYTEVYWTSSLEAIINFIKLRNHESAQWEIRSVARAIEQFARKKFPIATEVLLK